MSVLASLNAIINPSAPVHYLRAGLWKLHPVLAQSASFAAGVDRSFMCIPQTLQADAVAEAYAALLEQQLDSLSEADALRIVNLVATNFVQRDQRERGRNRKKKIWRTGVSPEQLVSPDDPVRALELAQTDAATKQLILSLPANLRHAMSMLVDENASPAERSVRNIMQATGLPRRTVAALQKQLEQVASGLNLHDSGTALSPGTGAAVGLGKLAAAVTHRSATPAARGSDQAEFKPDELGDCSSPRPKWSWGKSRFE